MFGALGRMVGMPDPLGDAILGKKNKGNNPSDNSLPPPSSQRYGRGASSLSI